MNKEKWNDVSGRQSWNVIFMWNVIDVFLIRAIMANRCCDACGLFRTPCSHNPKNSHYFSMQGK